jgi:hypothetical protein
MGTGHLRCRPSIRKGSLPCRKLGDEQRRSRLAGVWPGESGQSMADATTVTESTDSTRVSSHPLHLTASAHGAYTAHTAPGHAALCRRPRTPTHPSPTPPLRTTCRKALDAWHIPGPRRGRSPPHMPPSHRTNTGWPCMRERELLTAAAIRRAGRGGVHLVWVNSVAKGAAWPLFGNLSRSSSRRASPQLSQGPKCT